MTTSIKAVKLIPGNIWSGSRKLAVFTCPTELAFKKGNLKNHYPVKYGNKIWPDAEGAYQYFSQNHKSNLKYLKDLMISILEAKFEQYPVLIESIRISGGVDFIVGCSHSVYGKAKNWEGVGRKSGYIDCLYHAYVASVI
jgi:hypothetical protein